MRDTATNAGDDDSSVYSEPEVRREAPGADEAGESLTKTVCH